MTVKTTAQSKFYIGPVQTSDLDATGYAALTGWTQVKEISDLGEAGAEGKEVSFASIEDGYQRKFKGSIDSGTIELEVGRDPDDEGQNAMRAAAEAWDAYAFKVVLNDMPAGGTTATTFYFRGPVLSAKTTMKTADDVVKQTFKVAITGKIVEVPAA
jgi:hypothetical protein